MMFVGGGAGAAPKPPLAAPSGGAGARPAIGGATLGPHDLNDKTLLKDLFAMAAHSDRVPDFPADPAGDHHMTNPCPVPSAPTGLSCADAIHMRWFKPNDIYPNPIKLDSITYSMVGPKPAPAPDAHQSVGVAPPFMPFIGKCLELDPQPRVGNQGRHRALLERHGFDWNSPTPMQADHVQDVFWKGPDAFDNLWPLDSFKNQSAGSRQNLHQEIRFAETAGGPTKVMTLKEFKKTQWAPDPSHKRRFFQIDEIAF
jgi:serine/threonine protein kinase